MNNDFIWAHMPQFGMNMWGDVVKAPARDGIMAKFLNDAEFADLCKPENQTREAIRFDEPTWKNLSNALKTAGTNLILIDVGDFVIYPSHPELAIKGSWSAERMQAEVCRLKALGFQVIPKLNFSCCHDAWLKEYRKMIATETYYQLIRDLLCDAYAIFEKPAYIHLGMDEEDIYEYQARENTIVRMRQGDLWWHDLLLMVRAVERLGARAWVWSDYVRRNPIAEFKKRMPLTVVQSPWDYSVEKLSLDHPDFVLFKTLTDAGYDTIPCGSNCYGKIINFTEMTSFCRKNLNPEHFKGMLFAPWMATIPAWKRLLLQGAEIFGRAVQEARVS